MRKDLDSHIIHRIKEGEVTAFAELVDHHQDMAFSLALGILKSREDAEEVVQDSFIKAYQNLGEFRGQSAFSSWLYRIVYNTAISKKRIKKIQASSLESRELKSLESLSTQNGMHKLEITERKRLLKMAIGQLEEEDATLVLLYYYKEFSIEEICTITGLSNSNVKVRLYRARKELYSILSSMLKEELFGIL